MIHVISIERVRGREFTYTVYIASWIVQKPTLFQTVPGIDDLQAFEELKEAWYK